MPPRDENAHSGEIQTGLAVCVCTTAVVVGPQS